MSKLVMAYWDCPFCGTKGNRGDAVNCPSCGRARGDVQFYMKGYNEGETREEDERSDVEYLDEEQAKYVSKNPDWYCSFCNSLNSDNAQFCGNCGSSRADSESNYFEMLQKKKEREAAEAAAQPQPAQPKTKRRSPLLIFALIALAVILFLLFRPVSTDYKITGFHWIRNINVEENRMYSESGWTLPAGAEQTDARNEIHHYDQVLDHYEYVDVQRSRQVVDHYETYYTYEDNGNGTFSEISHERPVYTTEYYTETVRQPVYVSVPRYQTKYYYNIWRWTSSRNVTASGDDHNPVWPEVTLAENEREGNKAARFFITVENQKKAGETFTYLLVDGTDTETVWTALQLDQGIHIKSSAFGSRMVDDKGNKIIDLVQTEK